MVDLIRKANDYSFW